MSSNNLPVDRNALSKVFKDPRTLKAFEDVLQKTLGGDGGLVIDSSTVFTITGVGALQQARNDEQAAALANPVPIGGAYLNGSVLQIRRA
jgi:hypothetical protein